MREKKKEKKELGRIFEWMIFVRLFRLCYSRRCLVRKICRRRCLADYRLRKSNTEKNKGNYGSNRCLLCWIFSRLQQWSNRQRIKRSVGVPYHRRKDLQKALLKDKFTFKSKRVKNSTSVEYDKRYKLLHA
nr:hypothetical protein [Tanacetum cinerariifolium]